MARNSKPNTAHQLREQLRIDALMRLWIEADPRTAAERWAWAMNVSEVVRKSDARPKTGRTNRTRRGS